MKQKDRNLNDGLFPSAREAAYTSSSNTKGGQSNFDLRSPSPFSQQIKAPQQQQQQQQQHRNSNSNNNNNSSHSNFLTRIPPAPKQVRCSSNDSMLFDNNIDFKSAQKNQNNSALLQSTGPSQAPARIRVKRRLSQKQKDINKIISRICEERLFSILISECADAGIVSKQQANHYQMKEHYLSNHRGQGNLLNDTELLTKLNLNSNYNTISNYANTNRELKPNINHSSLTVDPALAVISKKHQRIKNFFSGINPAQLKMNILPPLNPVTNAYREAYVARSPKKARLNQSDMEDSEFGGTTEKQSNKFRPSNRSTHISHSFHISDSSRNLGGTNLQKDSKEIFIEDLEKIFSSNTMMPLHVYETDLEQYKQRIVPTPYKESFMPKNFKDRIVALNVKY